jgi:AraC family transcriptional regulator
LVVWILSGGAIVEERDLGGAWQAYRVKAGDFFLTNTLMPYEMRWKASGPQPLQVMHLYIGLPLFRRAIKEVLDQDGDGPRLRDVSGAKDEVLSMLLEHLRRELTARHKPSPLFAHGIAQSLAVHLIRNYTDPEANAIQHRGGCRRSSCAE